MDVEARPRPQARVVVFGGTGFLGPAVVRELLSAGHQVRVVARDLAAAQRRLPAGVKLLQGDALRGETLQSACEGAEYAVSLVAARRNQPQSMLEVNVDHPRRLADAARAHGLKGVVYVSAAGARLERQLRYLTSRYMGEAELRRSDVPHSILRFTILLGEEGGIARDFERLAEFAPWVVIPASGAQCQPLVRQDAARCVALSVGNTGLLGRTVNLGGPEILTYERLFEQFLEVRGIAKRAVKLPAVALQPPAWALELFLRDPVIVPDELRSLTVDNLGDGLDIVSSTFGFRPEQPSAWIPRHWSRSLAAA